MTRTQLFELRRRIGAVEDALQDVRTLAFYEIMPHHLPDSEFSQPASAVAERLSLDGPPRVGDLVLVDDDEDGDWRGIVIEAPDASELLKVVPLPMRLNAGRLCYAGEYDVSQWRVKVIARAGYDVDAEIREQSK